MAKSLFALILIPIIPMGTTTVAIINDTAEPYHPTVPRLMLYSCIISGSKGPPDAQMRPTHIRTEMTSAAMTNRYLFLPDIFMNVSLGYDLWSDRLAPTVSVTCSLLIPDQYCML
jgi:hypothetical protein